MSSHIKSSYSKRIHRLALGVEPLDFLQGMRMRYPIRVELEGKPPWIPLKRSDSYRRDLGPHDRKPAFSRHNSCLHVLLFHKELLRNPDSDSQLWINVRIYDNFRRIVPRRFRVPLFKMDAAEDLDAEPVSYANRIRRPVLFPGAAYGIMESATGLRGRVLRNDKPMRWGRAEAYLLLPDGVNYVLVGRAHVDDRGEFLLLIQPPASIPAVELADPLTVRVAVSGPAVQPEPIPSNLPSQDTYWDLPLEVLPAATDADHNDAVSSGRQFPTGYVTPTSASRNVQFELGKIVSHEVFNFTVP